jgi:hypothetical protein
MMNEACFQEMLSGPLCHEERLALGEAFEDNVAEGRIIGTDDIVHAVELAEMFS